MGSVTVYRQLLVSIGAILLQNVLCQASPIALQRETACLSDLPGAAEPRARNSAPNWQDPGDCLFSVTETHFTQCPWCKEPTITLISNATYCCPAYRQCGSAEEDQQMITCNGYVDTSEDFQKLAVDFQVFQSNLTNILETTKQHFEEISAIATALKELPGLVTKLNDTVENVWKALDILS